MGRRTDTLLFRKNLFFHRVVHRFHESRLEMKERFREREGQRQKLPVDAKRRILYDSATVFHRNYAELCVMKKTGSLSGNRLLLILTVAGILAAGVYFLADRISHRGEESQQTPVFGGWTYDREDQRLAAAALVKAGLTDYRWSDNCLWVPTARRGEYEKVLGENQALPQKPSALKQNALNEISAFESESRTKLRDLYSSARQLEKTLESFHQIESASVGPHSRREQSGLYPKTVVTAAISITPKESCSITPELISSITVASRHHLGITDNNDISIIDTVSGRSWLGTEGSVGRFDSSSHAMEEARLENLWSAKFREAFGYIPNLRVTTAVGLEAVRTEKEPDVTPTTAARRPIGLEFRDETDIAAVPETEIRFVPQTIAVSIAVPESYIRRLSDAETDSPEERKSRFEEKKREILSQMRQTAAVVMPTLGDDDGETRSIDISLYTDLSDEERVYRPVPENPEPKTSGSEIIGGVSLLVESPNEESAEAPNDLTAILHEWMTGPLSKYFLPILAFVVGIALTALVFFRSGGNAKKQNVSQPETESADTVRAKVAPQSEKSVDVPEPSRPLKQAVSEIGEEPRTDRQKMKEAELRKIFDELDAEDLHDASFSDKDDDAGEETITPSAAGKLHENFFSADTKDGTPRDFRVDSDSSHIDRPHFRVSETESGISEDLFSYDAEESYSSKTIPDRFSFLSELDSEELRELLSKQRPQVIALIARCASETNRARVLDVLANRLRAEVEKRIHQSGEPEEEIVTKVETSLRESLGIVGSKDV
jgi:hypothetical protein